MTGKEEKKRYSFKDYAPQVLKIEQATEQIKQAVKEMPDCSAKTSFEFSIKNLEKKIQKFTPAGKTLMSDDEKELLRKFRAGEIIVTAKEPAASLEEKKDEVPTSNLNVNLGGKKKGKQPTGKKA